MLDRGGDRSSLASCRPTALWPAGVSKQLPVSANLALDGPLSVRPFIGADAQICGRPVIETLLGGSPDKVPALYKATDPLAHPPRVRSVTVVTAALPPQDPALLAATGGK